MAENLKTELCIIGASAAGLEMAILASQKFPNVVLIDSRPLSRILSCNPHLQSASLSRAAGVQYYAKMYKEKGAGVSAAKANFAKLNKWIEDLESGTQFDVTAKDLAEIGITYIRGQAKFTGKETVQVDQQTIKAKKFIVCSALQFDVPNIPGLNSVKYTLPDSAFAPPVNMKKLIILGHDRLAVEAAQTYKRLGIDVYILGLDEGLLPNFSEQNQQKVSDVLIAEKIDVVKSALVLKVGKSKAGIKVDYQTNKGKKTSVTGSHLFVSPTVDHGYDALDLSVAGVKTLALDFRQRSQDNSSIYFMGPQFNHFPDKSQLDFYADHVVRNAIMGTSVYRDDLQQIRSVFMDPEIIELGYTVEQAMVKFKDVRVVSLMPDSYTLLQDCVRPAPSIQAIIARFGVVVGVSIQGPGAREHALAWSLCLSRRKRLSWFLNGFAPYPSLGIYPKQLAQMDEFENPTLLRKAITFLRKIFP